MWMWKLKKEERKFYWSASSVKEGEKGKTKTNTKKQVGKTEKKKRQDVEENHLSVKEGRIQFLGEGKSMAEQNTGFMGGWEGGREGET